MRANILTGLLSVLLIGALLPAQARSRLKTADDVMNCASANAPLRPFAAKLEISIRDRIAARRFVTRVLGGQDEQALLVNMRVQEPTSLAGSAFLLRERELQDDMWIYIPSMKATRQVTGTMASRELWSTGMSYMDVKQMFGGFMSGEATLQDDERYLDRDAKIVEIKPSASAQLPFDRVRLAIDEEFCVLLLSEYLDVDGRSVRQFRANPATITALGEHHLVTEYDLLDSVSRKRTRLTLRDLRFVPEAEEKTATFSPDGFFTVD